VCRGWCAAVGGVLPPGAAALRARPRSPGGEHDRNGDVGACRGHQTTGHNGAVELALRSGLFFDLGSHGVDLLDFFVGPITGVAGFPINTAGAYNTEDVTAAVFSFGTRVVGTGIWNFHAGSPADTITFIGSEGTLETPIFSDTDVIVTRGAERQVHEVRYPPHVHQPLIQTIVDELAGAGQCPSTGESGARASWVLDACLGRAARL
jgi:predicted dehydrogenase